MVFLEGGVACYYGWVGVGWEVGGGGLRGVAGCDAAVVLGGDDGETEPGAYCGAVGC